MAQYATASTNEMAFELAGPLLRRRTSRVAHQPGAALGVRTVQLELFRRLSGGAPKGGRYGAFRARAYRRSGFRRIPKNAKGKASFPRSVPVRFCANLP